MKFSEESQENSVDYQCKFYSIIWMKNIKKKTNWSWLPINLNSIAIHLLQSTDIFHPLPPKILRIAAAKEI